MDKWTEDKKNVYVRKDLVYNLICFTNLGVIEADELREDLGITHSQQIRIEREIIALIMTIFAKEIMVSQYKNSWATLSC